MVEDTLYTEPSFSASATAFAELIFSANPGALSLVRQLAFDCFQSASEGNSCLDATAYFADAHTVTEVSISLSGLFAGNRLVSVLHHPNQQVDACLLVVFKNRLYLKKYWLMENRLLKHICARCNDRIVDASWGVPQRLAYSCLYKPLTLLTGGPGTGKTSAISASLVHWITLFWNHHQRIPKIWLCAPTGKAASRMSEAWQQQKPAILQALDADLWDALPESAQTLHRLLAIHPISRTSRYSPERPLEADLVVFDEASMIDLPTTLLLFDALPDSCHLLMVGDPDQLPSIEIGNVLQELLSLPAGTGLQQLLDTAHIRLLHNFRQSDSLGLSTLASDIMHIDPSEVVTRLVANFYAGVGFFGNSPLDITELIDEAVSHYKTIAEQSTVEDALSMLSERIILSPVREGPCGSIALNARIGNRLHARGNRHGQVLMITENVPSLGLANGDIGLIWRNDDVFKVHFQLHGGMHTVSLSSLPRHEWAYSLTVHKSQGSEFGRVDLVSPDFDMPLLSRALIYTAVTRAKNSLALYAQAEVLLKGLQRNSSRMSGLALLASSA